MVRPLPPKIVSEKELRQISGSAPVAVVSDGPWRRKERVEWLENDVWWKAEVQGFGEDGSVHVQQYWPPEGERCRGDRYFVSPKCLRPAFSWTETNGWTADPKRVTFLNLSQALGSDSTSTVEVSGSAGVSRVPGKPTRPGQLKQKASPAGRLRCKSQSPDSLRTKRFKKGSDPGVPIENGKLSSSSGKDTRIPGMKTIHKMGPLQWKPLLSMVESLQPDLKTEGLPITGSVASDSSSDDTQTDDSASDLE